MALEAAVYLEQVLRRGLQLEWCYIPVHDHDERVCERLAQPPQPGGIDDAVVVGEGDHVTNGLDDPPVPRAREAPLGLPHVADRITGAEPLGSIVARAVVDDDHLEPWRVEREQALRQDSS